MSIEVCPDCNGELSSRAVACPSCGYVKNYYHKRLRTFLFSISGGAFSYIILNNTVTQNDPTEAMAAGVIYFSIAGLSLLVWK